jgi:hypothetical protein
MAGNTIEVEIDTGSTPGEYLVRVVHAPSGGEPEGTVRLPVDDLLERRQRVEETVLASSARARGGVVEELERPLRQVGHDLFEALFGGPLSGAYRSSQAVALDRGGRLRVVLRLRAPELAVLPWEALWDEANSAYVCRREPLVRHVPAPSPEPLPVEPPLRILGLVASPRGLPTLDVEAEQEHFEEALAAPVAEGRVHLEWEPQASWDRVLDRLLTGRWHVLHFIGHGDYDETADEGRLALVGDDGRADWVEASRLADLLGEAEPTPRLVVLNSCSSGASGTRDLFSGTAAMLVRCGISAVAAMQFRVSDRAAIAFPRGFYTALAAGRSVDEAVRSGRIAILGAPHSLEWVTPVLYLRGHTSHLFDMAAPTAPPGSARVPRPEREDSAPDPRAAPEPHDEPAARREPEPRSEPAARREPEPHDEPAARREPEPRSEPAAHRTPEPRSEPTSHRESERQRDPAARQEPETRDEPEPAPEPETHHQPEVPAAPGSRDAAAPSWPTEPAPDPLAATFPPSGPTAPPPMGPPLAGPGFHAPAGPPPSGPLIQHRPGIQVVQWRFGVEFTPDGSSLATAGGSWVRIWDARTGQARWAAKAAGWNATPRRGPAERGLNRAMAGASMAFARKTPGTVTGMSFSPDGYRLATASDDGTARLWDLDAGRQVWSVTAVAHGADVTGVAFAPDGVRLATVGTDGAGRVWDARTGNHLLAVGHGAPATAVAFSGDGTRLATAGEDGAAHIWDAATGRQLATVRHAGVVRDVAFSPDGSRLATAGADNDAHVWDVASGRQVATVSHRRAVNRVAFSRDGLQLATACDDGAARVTDVATGTEVCAFGCPAAVTDVCFSPDGRRLAVASEDKIARTWSVPDR